MSLNLTATVRKPTRLLTRDWAASLDAMRRNVRGRTYSDTYFDTHAGAVMLTPQVDPGYWQYGKDGYSLYVWNGASWALYPNAWTEGESAFGDEGGYVGFAGDSTYPATTPWAAYRADGYELDADGPIAFTLHWTPPSGTYLPKLEFWPRVDKTQTVTSGGYTYFYAGVGFYLDSTNADLVVCEYQYDDLSQLTAGNMLTETYRHPLDLTAMGLSNQWVSFILIPTPEQYTSAADSKVYYYDDFVLKSPMLKNGGFCYRTKTKRTGESQGGLRLFPSGIAGIRSLTGGLAALTLPYVYFPANGYFISQKFSKRQSDTVYPTVEWEAYEPSGTGLSYLIVDSEGNSITSGSEFQDFWVKVRLTASSGGYLSPIVYSITPKLSGTAADSSQTETDISADVSIQESVSEDLIGYRATVNLRNEDQTYNELVYRPANEIAFSFGGTNRSVLYTLNPSFPWYRIPDNSALFINWECGDFWTRLKTQYVTNMPDYGNQTINDAITDYMERLGFDTARLHIDSTLDGVNAVLPWSGGKDDPLCRPQDGSTADEFLADLHEKWFADYQMYFGADDDGGVIKPALYIVAPPDLTNPSNIHTTFYTSRTLAEGDPAAPSEPYYVNGTPTVTFQHDQFYNEIWVFGVEPATGNWIGDVWLDIYSQTDENYLYYVGERRITAVITRLPTWEYVHAYTDMLRKMLGRPRRVISFESKYDPTLRPGHYIKFYGLNMIFKVTSTGAPIDAQHVSQLYDDTVHGCTIEAVEWPTT